MRAIAFVVVGAVVVLGLSCKSGRSPGQVAATAARATRAATAPSVEPSGTEPAIARGEIAFQRIDGIYVMNADGSGQMRIAAGRSPAWSPDGLRLAYACNAICITNADGSGAAQLTHGDRDALPAWSPDGTRIAYVSTQPQGDVGDIMVIGADGTGQRRLGGDPAHLDGEPAWSPDGAYVAFVSARDGHDEVYVIGANGSGEQRLTANSTGSRRPAWSPDGRRIMFLATTSDPYTEIDSMNSDASGKTRLSLDGSSPVWSPDGSRVAFISTRGGDAELYVMNADGSSQRPISQGLSAAHPSWAPDGAWITISSGSEHAVYVVGSDGAMASRLASSDASDPAPAWALLR